MFTLMTVVCTLGTCEPLFFVQHVKRDECLALKQIVETQILFKPDKSRADLRGYRWICAEEA